MTILTIKSKVKPKLKKKLPGFLLGFVVSSMSVTSAPNAQNTP